MKKMNIFIYCLILLCSCGKQNSMNTKSIDIDEIFKTWNIATSKSIHLGINSTNNENQISLYKNRLEALKNYLAISDFQTINNNSIRYKFIKETIRNWNHNFYIVEANESGEQISIISYILFPNQNGTTKVFRYEYKKGDWVKTEENTMNYSFKFDRKTYSTTFGNGKNQNDVIITHIENNQIIGSDFFLFSTMKNLQLGSVTD